MKYIVIIILSFLLDGIVSMLLPHIYPVFTLEALLYCALFSKISKSHIIKISALMGFLYDIIYMNIFLFNYFGFTLLIYFILKLNVSHNNKSYLILNTIIIISYVLYIFLFILINDQLNINIIYVLKTFIIMLVVNLFYFEILLFLFKRSKQRKIPIYYYR